MDPYTRINYRYQDGPLKDEVVRLAVLTEELRTPILHTHTRRLAGRTVNEYAQGVYGVEQQEGGEWVAIHHPSHQDQEWHSLPTPPR